MLINKSWKLTKAFQTTKFVTSLGIIVPHWTNVFCKVEKHILQIYTIVFPPFSGLASSFLQL